MRVPRSKSASRSARAHRETIRNRPDPFRRLEGLLGGSHRQAHERRAGAGPAGLVAGAETRAVVAVKVLVEQHVIAPQRIFLKGLIAAEDRAPAAGVPQKDAVEPPREFLRDLKQVHLPARSRRALDG